MAQIDQIQRYRNFIKRLNQKIYICPKCRQFFNESTPGECGYSYQAGRQDYYINDEGKTCTGIKELACIETEISDFLNHLSEIDWEAIQNYFVITEWKYNINGMAVIPSISDLQDTVKELYQNLINAKDAGGIYSGGWDFIKTDNTIICKFVALPVSFNN